MSVPVLGSFCDPHQSPPPAPLSVPPRSEYPLLPLSPICELLTDVVEVGRESSPASVGHDDVDAAKGVFGTLDNLGNTLAGERVALDNGVALTLKGLEGALSALLVGRVVESEAHTLLCEERGDKSADTTSSAGDERALALERDHFAELYE